MPPIWVVSEYTSAQQNSTGYFWEKAIDQLRADGMKVEVLTLKNAVENSRKKSILRRAIAKFSAAFKLAWSVARKARRGEIVFSGTNPETLLLLLALLKPILGFRWYVLVHDVFPENLIPAGILARKNLSYIVLKSIFDWIYARPDRLFVIGRDMKKLVDEKTGRPNRSFFIHNWVDSGQIFSSLKTDSEIIQELQWEGKTVFQFFGNIGRVQGIPFLLHAIDLVKSERAAFLFIGTGACAGLVADYQLNNPQKNLRCLGELSQERKNDGLAACDVALITLESGMYGLGVPSKAYFSLAAGRPILAVMDAGSEISLMVDEEKIGWHCVPDDPKKLAELIDNICDSDFSEFAIRAKKLSQEKYSASAALAELGRLVRAASI